MILIPFESFEWSARSFRDVDLLDQRVTIYQMIRTLLVDFDTSVGRSAWAGYEKFLLAYQQALTYEMSVVRDIPDIGFVWNSTRITYLDSVKDPLSMPVIPPRYMRNPDWHISHQSELLRRDSSHYEKMFPGIRNDHPYLWKV